MQDILTDTPIQIIMGAINTKPKHRHVRMPIAQIAKQQLPTSEPTQTTQTLPQTYFTDVTSAPLAIVSDGSWRITGNIPQQVFHLDPTYYAGAAVAAMTSTQSGSTNTVFSITGMTRSAANS